MILTGLQMFLPYHDQIKPYKAGNDLVRIIYNWEDDVHWIYKKSFDDFDINPVALNEYFTLRLLRTCYDG